MFCAGGDGGVFPLGWDGANRRTKAAYIVGHRKGLSLGGFRLEGYSFGGFEKLGEIWSRFLK